MNEVDEYLCCLLRALLSGKHDMALNELSLLRDAMDCGNYPSVIDVLIHFQKQVGLWMSVPEITVAMCEVVDEANRKAGCELFDAGCVWIEYIKATDDTRGWNVCMTSPDDKPHYRDFEPNCVCPTLNEAFSELRSMIRRSRKKYRGEA